MAREGNSYQTHKPFISVSGGKSGCGRLFILDFAFFFFFLSLFLLTFSSRRFLKGQGCRAFLRGSSRCGSGQSGRGLAEHRGPSACLQLGSMGLAGCLLSGCHEGQGATASPQLAWRDTDRADNRGPPGARGLPLWPVGPPPACVVWCMCRHRAGGALKILPKGPPGPNPS